MRTIEIAFNTLLRLTNITEEELRELVIDRFLNNDYESQGLFEHYCEAEDYAKEDGREFDYTFNEYLTKFYKDLGTAHDNTFEKMEELVLTKVANNYHYLD